MVFLVIAGRAKVTTRNFPAALAGLAANVILLLVLVPSLGIAGAGIALCGAYVVMIAVMHLLTRRAFAAAFEWRRLAQLALVLGGMAAAGELLLPDPRRRRVHHPRARCWRRCPASCSPPGSRTARSSSRRARC